MGFTTNMRWLVIITEITVFVIGASVACNQPDLPSEDNSQKTGTEELDLPQQIPEAPANTSSLANDLLRVTYQ